MAYETKELRGDAPADLVKALDAIALSYDMPRNEYVVKVLMDHVRVVLRRSNMQTKLCTGNPLMGDIDRKHGGESGFGALQ